MSFFNAGMIRDEIEYLERDVENSLFAGTVDFSKDELAYLKDLPDDDLQRALEDAAGDYFWQAFDMVRDDAMWNLIRARKTEETK